MCSSCKKIRDDEGYWNQVEEYIYKHSEAQFSHGICPDCITKLYPDFQKRRAKLSVQQQTKRDIRTVAC